MSPRASPRHSPPGSPVQSLRHLQDGPPSRRDSPPSAAIDPALSDPRTGNPSVHYHYHHHPPPPPPPGYYAVDRWHHQQPNFAQPVYQHPHHRYPPHPDDMPHRVDPADRSGSISHRQQEDRGPYDHPNTHPSPPPIAAIHNSPAPSQASEQVASPSPPVPQPAYYQGPPPNGPPMHQAYPYPPHARYPADPAVQMPPGYPPSSHYAPPPVFEQPSYIIHTDDAATKLNDRVRRKCYNCRTTDTSTWRRSSLTPGKVLCNKCGLFERTHSRPRPEQFPHKRGPIVTGSFKSSRSPPPQSRLPPMQHHMAPLPPHHYDHPSIAPLMPQRADGHPQYAQPPPPGGGGSPNPSAIGNLLNSPPAGGAPPAQGSPVPAHASASGGGAAPSGAVAPAENGGGQGSSANGHSLKRPRSPSADRSPRQEQRSPPYAYRAPASAASAA
ncbi:hypothetical protein PsYK624_169440 [Phanerochaete sordida]|uniref:GATA-type domain-containing protein n=1 Tax=Phanerochaete sordida TaxID=48140 RepID=A0A9P3LPF0_9APHY|nr:hypothetical protein PsYK624_169440 [Phanerochaete sordida]